MNVEHLGPSGKGFYTWIPGIWRIASRISD